MLEQLLPFIRFPTLDTRYLLEGVKNIPVLEVVPVAHQLVHEALRYKVLPATSALDTPSRCKPRKGKPPSP